MSNKFWNTNKDHDNLILSQDLIKAITQARARKTLNLVKNVKCKKD